jgi:hypothetical protein
MNIWLISFLGALGLALAPLSAALASGHSPGKPEPSELDEGELFFELNDTDGDLGIHASIDGGPYHRLDIIGPDGRQLLKIQAKSDLGTQGLTQLFFESAEPRFSELSPAEFFERFPEGDYTLRARGEDGETFEEEVELSHVLAAPAGNVFVDGEPAAENCDADPLPSASGVVIIDWDPVTTSHPTIGAVGDVVIERYQFFVETDDVTLGVDLPPDVTEFEVPASILATADEFKFEIIARTEDGNNTAVESCFEYE